MVATRYQGCGRSALVVDGPEVVIEHGDDSVGGIRIDPRRITGVHFEPATRFMTGIITVAVNGEELVVPAGIAPGSDPYTVLSRRKDNDTFHGLHLWIQQLVAENVRQV